MVHIKNNLLKKQKNCDPGIKNNLLSRILDILLSVVLNLVGKSELSMDLLFKKIRGLVLP